jgi:hypothetical protein
VFIDEEGKYDLHSDHVIISADLELNNKSINCNDPKGESVLKWKINENTDWEAFQTYLKKAFELSPLPVCNNVNTIWETWKNNIDNTANHIIGKHRKVKNYKKFWDKELEGLIKSRQASNRLKRSHDKLRQSDSHVGKLLTDSYMKRKKAVQEAVQRKINADKMRLFNNKCINSKNKAKGFWEMLRDNKANVTPSQIIDPVDKTTIIDKKGKIEKCLIKHFGDIGRDSTHQNEAHTNYVKTFISQAQNDKIPTKNMFSLNIQADIVQRALVSLKSGKAVGLDGIPNEFLKFGGDVMITSLTNLFITISDLEQTPSDWQKGIIIPIHKSASIYDLNNYRGITLTSNVYKIYASIMENTIMAFLEDKNVLGESQGAFRKNRRPEDHLFTLNVICSQRKSSKLKTYIAFLDLSKAFDRVWRDGLFYLLWKNGVQGKIWRLLKEIYSNVENKVIFGSYKSEWFDQDFGVKQGCILSPTLFSILMKDLSDMLEKENIGVSFSSKIINALMYADDVALIAESESDLRKMLKISHDFACKWNLKFNHSKSKVLVVGQRIDKNRKWYLGNEKIDETDNYKYLGVYLSRNLKPTHHILKYLKENLENKLNGMVRILGKHGEFNRVEFGNALWTSVIRPCIAHGCSIWLPSSEAQRNLLQSIQYKAAKIILRTKINIPISALLLELGWEPINAFLDRQRISYFSRFSELNSTRLCKQTFDELFSKNIKEWPYFDYIRSLFESVGLDHFINGSFNKGTFYKFFGEFTRRKELDNIDTKSSLHLYKTFNITGRTQKYLININDFRGSRLKLLARTNCLPVNSTLCRMQIRTNPQCTICTNNYEENVNHVLLECEAYTNLRNELNSDITTLFCGQNVDADFTGLPPHGKMMFLIGDLGYHFSNFIGDEIDKLCKRFLCNIFMLRSQIAE